MKVRLVLLLSAAAAVALAVAGCGGGSDSSGSDPATLVPPKAPVFVEATIQPEGDLATNIESLTKNVGGIEDIGALIVSKLEESASGSGEEVDFAKEVEPWLGEKAGLFLESYDGNDFSGYGVAVATTDSGEAEEFVEKRSEASGETPQNESYEGVDFEVQEDGTAIGVVGDFLVVAENETSFKKMVDAEKGESLAEEDSYTSTVSQASDGSLADVFVDIGGLIKESPGAIDSETQAFLDTTGIDPEDATAVASLIPGTEQVEIDISTDLSKGQAPIGDASKLLGALPADSVAAFASSDFGKRLGEGIDKIDEEGIPGQLKPNEFKSALSAAGIDVDKIAASLGDLGVFVEGSSESSLGGAVVLETTNSAEATNTVSNVGLLLRASHTPGITAIGGKFSGFSIRDNEIGPQPIVVAAKGERIAIAYGLPAATKALESGSRLSESSGYKAAVSSLGSTPISGFVEGPAALKLITAMVPADEEEGFLLAKPYLSKVDYVAIGATSSGDLATVKLIAGVGK
jgi:hypothetical protein